MGDSEQCHSTQPIAIVKSPKLWCTVKLQNCKARTLWRYTACSLSFSLNLIIN